MFVKICGITDEVAARACVVAGVDAVGFVFASSPRRVVPEAATAMASSIPDSILKVAVFRRPSTRDIEAVLETFTPDLIQADHDTLPGDLVHGIATLPVYREGVASDPRERRFLYEGRMSGLGETVDLRRAAEIARGGEMILAGGLTPRNVAEVIWRVHPYGVDVSSGVESEPGRKDPEAIHAFVVAARTAQERLVEA